MVFCPCRHRYLDTKISNQDGNMVKNIQSPDLPASTSLLLISSVRNTLRLPCGPNTTTKRGESSFTSLMRIYRLIHQIQYLIHAPSNLSLLCSSSGICNIKWPGIGGLCVRVRMPNRIGWPAV